MPSSGRDKTVGLGKGLSDLITVLALLKLVGSKFDIRATATLIDGITGKCMLKDRRKPHTASLTKRCSSTTTMIARQAQQTDATFVGIAQSSP